MKKTLFCCFLLFSFFQYGKANAQPSRHWATYYGQYAQYTSNYINNHVLGTIITDVKFDKRDGYVYITGATSDTLGIASQGSFKSHFVSKDLVDVGGGLSLYGKNVFLAKFDTLGHRIWATYYGGNRDVYEPSMALDNRGNIYITGTTSSDSGIATPGTHKTVFTGVINQQTPGLSSYLPFLVKFDSSGHRVWGTYFGQNLFDNSVRTTIAFDTLNHYIYIAGATSDTYGIATQGSFEDHLNGSSTSGYIAKFDTSGIQKWGTYYSGNHTSDIVSLWIGRNGDLYAIGNTTSDSGIATQGAYVDSSSYGGNFLVKFDSAGYRQWATYTNLSGAFQVYSMTGTVDEEGGVNLYILGYTYPDTTGSCATTNAYQPHFGGGITDMVFMKYGGDGIRKWSTYFGGNGDEPAITFGITGEPSLSVDDKGDIYMVSTTNSTQGIQHACQPLPTSHQRSIIAKWNPNGDLIWSSYADADLVAVCAGNGDNFYIGGYTSYDGLATPGSHQPTKVTNKPSGFFAKLSSECPYISIPVSENQNLLSVGDSFDTYQWYQNGNVVSGADSNVYSVPVGDSGNYYVLVTKSCGCSYHSDTVHYHTTGINEMISNGWNLQLFPNPTTGGATFSFDLLQPKNISVSVYDLVGRQLLKKVYGTLSGQQEKRLNVSDLQSGLYFVKFEIGGQQVVRKLEVE